MTTAMETITVGSIVETRGATASNAQAASAFAITTTFTAPPACSQTTGGFTMLKNRQYQIWLNEPVPVPSTTITSCYPSQFISSYLLERGGLTQAPFSPLVCPQGYTTQGPYTSNYIACCPSGFDGLALAAKTSSNRPAYSGTCYLNIYNKPIRVTVYDDASVQASSIFTATDSLAQAYAYPYEGFAFGVAEVASTTTTTAAGQSAALATLTPTAATTFSSSSSSSSPPSSTTPSAATTSPPVSSPTPLPSGTIAGIVIGSIACALLAALLLLLFLRYRRHNHNSSRATGDLSDVPIYSPQGFLPISPATVGIYKPTDSVSTPPTPEHTPQPAEMPHERTPRWHELDAAEREKPAGEWPRDPKRSKGGARR